ncbi:MAG TPA: hypothetical protein VH274_01295 [Mycobacteriales bacterium]|nr:hypothetical protein [Mycobacteriales bacterium]
MRGVYLIDGDMFDDVPEHLWWRAALHAHGANACLVGWTGARAIGAAGLPATDPTIDLALIGGGSRHRRALDPGPLRMSDGRKIVIRQWPVAASEVEVVDAMRVRTPQLTVIDAALMLDRVHSLCLFDWALHAELMTKDELLDLVGHARRRPGVVHVREAATHADRRSESPLESRIRLACIDGLVPPDDLQYPVEDQFGGVIAYGDLVWLRRKGTTKPLIGEADGREPHSRPRPLFYDRRRQNAVVGRACDVVRFTWVDALKPTYVQHVVRTAMAAA